MTAESRLPLCTSSQFIEESRSRVGLPCILQPSHGSRMILPPNLLKNRGLALDFLTICDRFCAGLPWHNLWRNQWRNLIDDLSCNIGRNLWRKQHRNLWRLPDPPIRVRPPDARSSSVACFPGPSSAFHPLHWTGGTMNHYWPLRPLPHPRLPSDDDFLPA